MASEIAPIDGEHLGPAMRALNPRQRAFVMAYCEMAKPSAAEACRLAGYTDHPGSKDSHGNAGSIRVQAARLMQNEAVKAAMQEECRRRLAWDLPVRIAAVRKIADNDQHPDAFKANIALLNRGGLPDVKETHVTHEVSLSDQEKWAEIIEIYRNAGLPPPAGAPTIIDITPTEASEGGNIVIDGEEY